MSELMTRADGSMAHQALTQAAVALSRISVHEAACALRQKEITDSLVRLHERMDSGQRMVMAAFCSGLITLLISAIEYVAKSHQ